MPRLGVTPAWASPSPSPASLLFCPLPACGSLPPPGPAEGKPSSGTWNGISSCCSRSSDCRDLGHEQRQQPPTSPRASAEKAFASSLRTTSRDWVSSPPPRARRSLLFSKLRRADSSSLPPDPNQGRHKGAGSIPKEIARRKADSEICRRPGVLFRIWGCD